MADWGYLSDLDDQMEVKKSNIENKKEHVNNFLDEMYDILSESINEPAGQGCGYGITEQGRVAIEVELFNLLRKLGVIE